MHSPYPLSVQDERHRYLHGRGHELQQYLGRGAQRRSPSPGLEAETRQDGTILLDSDEETLVGSAGPDEGEAGPSNWQQINGHAIEPADFGTMNGHLNGHPHHQQLNGHTNGAGQQQDGHGAMNGHLPQPNGHPVQPSIANGYRLEALLPARHTNGTELYPGPANFVPPDRPLRNGHVPSPPMTSPASPMPVNDQLRAHLYHWAGTQDAESALTTDGAYPHPAIPDLDVSELPPLPASVDGADETLPVQVFPGVFDGLAALQPVANGAMRDTSTSAATGTTGANGDGANGPNGDNRHESLYTATLSDVGILPEEVESPSREDNDDDEQSGGFRDAA